jgi:hypothetical protein
VLANLDWLGIDYLIPIGGDDTLSYGVHLAQEGVKVVAIPKTMDNDVPGTDYCIGFSTCVTRTIELTNNLRTSAGSHERFLVLEVFGRYAGFTAMLPTMAGAATAASSLSTLRHRAADGAVGRMTATITPASTRLSWSRKGAHVRGRRHGFREPDHRRSTATQAGRYRRPDLGSCKQRSGSTTTANRSTSSTSGWATWCAAATPTPSTPSCPWRTATWRWI